MRRIVSLYLPHWSSDQWHRRKQQQTGTPSNRHENLLALTQHRHNRVEIAALSPALVRQGAAAGQALADVRAALPHIIAHPLDAAADQQVLQNLGLWLTRYSPIVALDTSNQIVWPDDLGQAGFFIDSTGADHLCGGEEAMLADMLNRLAKAGITAHASVAPNAAAAWALARFGADKCITPDMLLNAISPLSIQALRLDMPTLATLGRLGLKQIGDLLALPRTALAKRFRDSDKRHSHGAAKAVSQLILRLDQISGRQSETITPITPPPTWRVSETFAEPMLNSAPLPGICQRLLHRLFAALERANTGILRLRLDFYSVDGSRRSRMVSTSQASRDTAHISRLIADSLDGIELGFGLDHICLSVVDHAAFDAEQSGLGNSRQHDASAQAKLVDQLSSRLGAGAVQLLQHQASHLPERQQRPRHPSAAIDNSWDDLPNDLASRPIRLLLQPEPIDVIAGVPEHPPQRFRWRRVLYAVAMAEGPERLSAEWWQHLDTDLPPTRDYYRVDTDAGPRFWLFRAGLYATPAVRLAEPPKGSLAPKWYLHGLFG